MPELAPIDPVAVPVSPDMAVVDPVPVNPEPLATPVVPAPLPAVMEAPEPLGVPLSLLQAAATRRAVETIEQTKERRFIFHSRRAMRTRRRSTGIIFDYGLGAVAKPRRKDDLSVQMNRLRATTIETSAIKTAQSDARLRLPIEKEFARAVAQGTIDRPLHRRNFPGAPEVGRKAQGWAIACALSATASAQPWHSPTRLGNHERDGLAPISLAVLGHGRYPRDGPRLRSEGPRVATAPLVRASTAVSASRSSSMGLGPLAKRLFCLNERRWLPSAHRASKSEPLFVK
jgi:hypothetical protein